MKNYITLEWWFEGQTHTKKIYEDADFQVLDCGGSDKYVIYEYDCSHKGYPIRVQFCFKVVDRDVDVKSLNRYNFEYYVESRVYFWADDGGKYDDNFAVGHEVKTGYDILFQLDSKML